MRVRRWNECRVSYNSTHLLYYIILQVFFLIELRHCKPMSVSAESPKRQPASHRSRMYSESNIFLVQLFAEWTQYLPSVRGHEHVVLNSDSTHLRDIDSRFYRVYHPRLQHIPASR